jgi:hypothetical protein
VCTASYVGKVSQPVPQSGELPVEHSRNVCRVAVEDDIVDAIVAVHHTGALLGGGGQEGR